MNGRGEDVSIGLVFTAQQMCAQNVLKNSVLNRTLFITWIRSVTDANVTMADISKQAEEWLSEYPDATKKKNMDGWLLEIYR